MSSPKPSFPDGVDLALRTTEGGEAVFGRDVLSSLVAGLDEATRTPRTERWWGPGVLGCAMWMDDPQLIDVLGRMANVCIVVTKQAEGKYTKDALTKLARLAAECGLAQAAYQELSELAPQCEGRPLIVGPGSPPWIDQAEIGAVREVGYRKVGSHLVPIVHAKIMLLGRMGWTDEHPSGAVVDHLFFVPEKMWIGSANFTQSSRSSLEMGMWTADEGLMAAARDWLLTLVGLSEPIGSGPDHLEPQLVPVEYDDAAIFEYLRDRQDLMDDDRESAETGGVDDAGTPVHDAEAD